MNRTLFKGGRVFDGTGAPLAEADVVVEGGRILEVGSGLDGDEAVDAGGCAVLPGMFDCHVHVVVSTIDLLVDLQQPFSYQFFAAARNLERTLDRGITTVRDAGGADLGSPKASPIRTASSRSRRGSVPGAGLGPGRPERSGSNRAGWYRGTCGRSSSGTGSPCSRAQAACSDFGSPQRPA
jgi:imidazolonepropionase-like amidohydrolase